MKPFAAVVLLFFVLGIGVPAQAQFYSGYCPTCAAVVYDTCWGPAPCANSFANGAISATMATLTSATRYRFNVTMSQHTVGTLCGTTTATVTVSYTDSDSGQSISSPVVGLSGTSGTPIATWTIPNSLGPTTPSVRLQWSSLPQLAVYSLPWSIPAAQGCSRPMLFTHIWNNCHKQQAHRIPTENSQNEIQEVVRQ